MARALDGETADITVLMQDLGQGCKFLQRVFGLRTNLQSPGGKVTMNAVLTWRQPGQVSGTGGGTNRVVRKGLSEAHSLLRHPIDVRCFEVRIAVTTKLPCALVVSENEDDVWPVRRRGKAIASEQEYKDSAEEMHVKRMSARATAEASTISQDYRA